MWEYLQETDDEENKQAALLGYPLVTDGPDRLGWLININSVSQPHHQTQPGRPLSSNPTPSREGAPKTLA